jgi:predicted DNA-binding transcriptional regulator YafY
MDKWEKIYALHNLLTTSRYAVPLDRILEKLDCSKATFHRIREFLVTRFNAPICFNHTYNGYSYNHATDAPFELPGLWFTTEELEALACFDYLLTGIHSDLLTGVLNPVRSRLETILKAQKIPRADWKNRIKIIPIASRTIDTRVLHEIADAILHSRKAEITYTAASTDIESSRTLSPLTLLRYRDNWYVDAWCHLRNSLRTFAVNRITSVRVLKEKAIHVPEKQLTRHFADSYGIFSGEAEHLAEIRFTGYAAKIVSREQWHPRQQLSLQPDNSWLLKIPFHESRELVMDIMRWGSDAEVIGPRHLRAEFEKILQKTLKIYEKNRPVS